MSGRLLSLRSEKGNGGEQFLLRSQHQVANFLLKFQKPLQQKRTVDLKKLQSEKNVKPQFYYLPTFILISDVATLTVIQLLSHNLITERKLGSILIYL